MILYNNAKAEIGIYSSAAQSLRRRWGGRSHLVKVCSFQEIPTLKGLSLYHNLILVCSFQQIYSLCCFKTIPKLLKTQAPEKASSSKANTSPQTEKPSLNVF